MAKQEARPSQRRTIKDLRAAAALSHLSPQTDVIIFYGSPSVSPVKTLNETKKHHTLSTALPTDALRTTSLMDECLSSQSSVASNMMDKSQESFDSIMDKNVVNDPEHDSVTMNSTTSFPEQLSYNTKENQIDPDPDPATLNKRNGAMKKSEKFNYLLQNTETEESNDNYQVIESKKSIGNYQVIETERFNDSKTIPKSFKRSSSNLPPYKETPTQNHYHNSSSTSAAAPTITRKKSYSVGKGEYNFADFDRESSDSSEDDEYSYVSKE